MIECNADYELHESRHREFGQDEQDWLRAEQDEQDWLRAQQEISPSSGSKGRHRNWYLCTHGRKRRYYRWIA
jgi:hypothetical protein